MTVTTRASALVDTVDKLIGQGGIRHAVIAVESGDETLSAVVAGGPAQPDGPPLRADTPFHYASVTKLYTATAVLQLWEQDRVDLDVGISTYPPSELTDGLHRLKGVDRSAAITVRHLMAHTSGLPDYFLDTPGGETSFTDRIEKGDFSYTLDEVVDRTRRLTPSFPPHRSPDRPSNRRSRNRSSSGWDWTTPGSPVTRVTGSPAPPHPRGHVVGRHRP